MSSSPGACTARQHLQLTPSPCREQGTGMVWVQEHLLYFTGLEEPTWSCLALPSCVILGEFTSLSPNLLS